MTYMHIESDNVSDARIITEAAALVKKVGKPVLTDVRCKTAPLAKMSNSERAKRGDQSHGRAKYPNPLVPRHVQYILYRADKTRNTGHISYIY